MLALLYETVRRIDEDPRTALTLRGFHDSLDGPADDGDLVERWTPLTALDPHSFYDM